MPRKGQFPHPEHHLSGFISEIRIELQTVQLLRAPFQQHGLHMFTGRAVPQEFIQHFQGSYYLVGRGVINYREVCFREGKVLSGFN